ncbi:DNA repair protein RecO [Ascidiimonas aurantiaca]|uniref:DNA repair protein RecO n=1 Tax=Ascidiimonas aurantiaca TaxID=1685432 RepID=UPI0030EB7FA7
MIVSTKAIVLSAIKYGDTSLIVKCLTASSGIHSYLLKGVLKSKKGKLKAAYFQPLTQLEIVASHNNKASLQHLREARVYYTYTSVYADIKKGAIAFFIAEVLANAIHEEEANKIMYQFVETSLQWLDTHDETANFHMIFLIQLTRYLGFYPDNSESSLPFFDLQEGAFTRRATSTGIGDNELVVFKQFLATSYDKGVQIPLRKAERSALLKTLLTFYQLHIHGFKKPRSITVLNEIFN